MLRPLPLLTTQVQLGPVLFIGGHTGPTMSALVDDFVAAVGGTRVEYDASPATHHARTGTRALDVALWIS